MFHPIRRNANQYFFFLVIACLLFAISTVSSATTSCDNSTDDCEDMCSHIYDTCDMSLVSSSGSALSESGCVSSCGSTDAAVVSCLAAATCSATAIDNCLVYADASGDDATTDSAYIGDAGVTDGATTTSGGACGEITDCNSCITNCRCRYDGTVAASTCCTGCGCECELYCMPTEWWIATCM